MYLCDIKNGKNDYINNTLDDLLISPMSFIPKQSSVFFCDRYKAIILVESNDLRQRTIFKRCNELILHPL